MKLAVVGSINMDMTVTAERIPLKGRHFEETAFIIFREGKVRIRRLLWQSSEQKWRCSDVLEMTQWYPVIGEFQESRCRDGTYQGFRGSSDRDCYDHSRRK